MGHLFRLSRILYRSDIDLAFAPPRAKIREMGQERSREACGDPHEIGICEGCAQRKYKAGSRAYIDQKWPDRGTFSRHHAPAYDCGGFSDDHQKDDVYDCYARQAEHVPSRFHISFDLQMAG
jgi:hypothetical protein